MVDPDILRAIEKINARIASLQQVRDRLAQEFGVGIETTASPRPLHVTSRGHRGPTRKHLLIEELRQRGPMKRADIVALGLMPEGSVSFCLRDKTAFRLLPDGRWDAVNTQTDLPITEAG